MAKRCEGRSGCLISADTNSGSTMSLLVLQPYAPREASCRLAKINNRTARHVASWFFHCLGASMIPYVVLHLLHICCPIVRVLLSLKRYVLGASTRARTCRSLASCRPRRLFTAQVLWCSGISAGFWKSLAPGSDRTTSSGLRSCSSCTC